MFKVGGMFLRMSALPRMAKDDFEEEIEFKWGRVVTPCSESFS